MSRFRDKHPDKVCPNGRKHCGACQLCLDYVRKIAAKDDRQDAGRSEERTR